MAHTENSWQEAKTQYIEGHPQDDGSRMWQTLEQVGLAHGISSTSIRHRAGREGWKDQRDLYQQKIAQARQEKRTDVLAAKGAEFDARALRATEAIIQHVVVHLSTSAKAKVPLPIATLARMAQTVSMAHKAGRLAMGDTTELQKLVGNVTHEWDLSNLDDAELAMFERLQRKMQGLPAPAGVH